MGLWLCGRVGVETWGALAWVCLCGCVGAGAGVGARVCVFVQFGVIVSASYDEYTALVKSGNVVSKHVNGWKVRSKRQI